MVVHTREDAVVGVDVDEGDDNGLSGLSWMPTKSGRSHFSLLHFPASLVKVPRGDEHT